MYRVQGRAQVHTGCLWEDLSERDHLEDPGINGGIILRLFFMKWDGGTWTGLIWLRIGKRGGLL